MAAPYLKPHWKPSWQEYERLKREYIRTHPEATPEEYARAIGEIAKVLGL